jgi:hypothetical protein
MTICQTDANELMVWTVSSDSLAEMHTSVVILVNQFDFSLPENGAEVIWTRINTPVVVGEERKGPQLPLMVTVLGSE